MTERLYLDRPDVYMLADCDAREGGRARLVVCEHPDGADYATRLAASLGLPVRYGPGPGELDGDARQQPRRRAGPSGPTAAALGRTRRLRAGASPGCRAA